MQQSNLLRVRPNFYHNELYLSQVNAASGQTMTVGELCLRSIRLARSLQIDGVVAGDVIGLCSENRVEFPVVLFAVFLLGATVAPLNITYIEGMESIL